MGCLSELFGMYLGNAEQKAKLAALKRGKSPEQKRVIDFFVGEGSGGCGCLGKGSSGIVMDEYLKIVNDKVQSLDLKNKAIAKIGLDETQISEIEPLVLCSFVYDDDVYYKFENNMVVTNQYSVTWIFFSAEQIYTYRFIFDTTSDNTWEITKDFFYSDITCFSTVREVKERIDTSISSGCLKGGKESTTKTLYYVDRFSIVAPGTDYTVSMTNSPTMERSVQAAKAMLREKKYR